MLDRIPHSDPPRVGADTGAWSCDYCGEDQPIKMTVIQKDQPQIYISGFHLHLYSGQRIDLDEFCLWVTVEGIKDIRQLLDFILPEAKKIEEEVKRKGP